MNQFLKKLQWFLSGPRKTGIKNPEQGPLNKVFPLEIPLEPDKFSFIRLFDGPTSCLHKLQCHFSQLPPGKGYDAHIDPYDVP